MDLDTKVIINPYFCCSMVKWITSGRTTLSLVMQTQKPSTSEAKKTKLSMNTKLSTSALTSNTLICAISHGLKFTLKSIHIHNVEVGFYESPLNFSLGVFDGLKLVEV